MDKETEQVDPALFTKEDAAKFLKGVEALLKSIDGKTGEAANLRLLLASARDRAGNVK